MYWCLKNYFYLSLCIVAWSFRNEYRVGSLRSAATKKQEPESKATSLASFKRRQHLSVSQGSEFPSYSKQMSSLNLHFLHWTFSSCLKTEALLMKDLSLFFRAATSRAHNFQQGVFSHLHKNQRDFPRIAQETARMSGNNDSRCDSPLRELLLISTDWVSG